MSPQIIYTANVHTTGGREGTARSSDDQLDVVLSRPGSSQPGTNPEQLFAAGWSACFLGALGKAAAERKVAVPAGSSVDAQVDLVLEDGGFSLAAVLNVALPGIERELGEQLLSDAHQICPYSKATRGNIEVTLKLA
jgi:osmotically inducible protein OsmC